MCGQSPATSAGCRRASNSAAPIMNGAGSSWDTVPVISGPPAPYPFRNRMRSGSRIQSSPAGARFGRTKAILCTRARTACLSCLFDRRTMIPAYSAGGYARMFAKSRSSVIGTRPSARHLTAIVESSAPVRRSSATVSASNPPPRKISAHSLGRFSSIFSFKPYVPKEDPPCPRAPVRQHRPVRPECPVPE